MPDLSETIKSLENYEPYARNFTSIRVKSDVILDALDLLKELKVRELTMEEWQE